MNSLRRAVFIATVTMALAALAEQPAPDTPTDDLPTISKYQMPGIVPNIGCMDPTSGQPCVDDGGGGGYTEGACNCSRLCGNGSGCLISVSNNGCQANPYPQGCKPCSGKCYGQ